MDSSESLPAPDQPSTWSGELERRENPRMGRWGTAWVYILPEGSKLLVYLHDLAQGGCSVEADAPIPAQLNSLVEVLLHVDHFSLRLAGIVRHLEEENTKAGIAFTAVNSRKAGQIARMMAALVEAESKRLAGVEQIGG